MPAVQASEAGEAYKMNAHVPNRGKFFAFVRGDEERKQRRKKKEKTWTGHYFSRLVVSAKGRADW
jgi:hypothetical protein